MEITIKFDSETLEALLKLAEALHGPAAGEAKKLCACAGVAQAPAPAAKEPAARKRRTKAEIQAEAEAEAAKKLEGCDPLQELIDKSAAENSDIESEDPDLAAPPPEVATVKIDITGLRAAANAIAEKSATARQAVIDVIKRLSPTGKMAGVPSAKYAEFLELLDAIDA